jgi:hypothetical protein
VAEPVGHRFGMSPDLEASTGMINFRPLEIKKCYGILHFQMKRITQISRMVRSIMVWYQLLKSFSMWYSLHSQNGIMHLINNNNVTVT